jgi:hypothetical protein
MRPLWRNVAGSLARIIPVPPGAELWYDARDIAFLREDAEVEAKIASTRAQAIRQLLDGGFTAESAIAAVTTGDFDALEHTGLLSVQLQEPGALDEDTSPNGSEPVATPA